MSNYKFLFDLDSTLTRQEILPTISEAINKQDEMRELTEKTMAGDIPFEQSFKSRVDILKDIPVSWVSKKVAETPMIDSLINFLNENHERCFIITSNLDVWIVDLMKKIHMENNFFSSKAEVKNDSISSITHILDKGTQVSNITGNTIAVGDGNNDAPMLKNATIGIGFGGIRPIAPSVLQVADLAVFNDQKLCEILRSYL